MTKTLKLDEVELVRKQLFVSDLVSHNGTMVDVGAHKGTSFSHFMRAGWEIWAFEPSTVMYNNLVARFGSWRNVQLFPVAVSDSAADGVSFFTSEQSTGISSLLDFHESHELSEMVSTRRLDSLPIAELDFLKIDTEGFDRNVFRSRGDLTPRVLVTEFEDNKTLDLGYTAAEYADELVEAGYHLWVSVWDPIVRYGGDHNWREFFRYSGNPPDSATWGNFIGVHHSVGVDVDEIEAAMWAGLPVA